jgi:hypothetical protein
VIAVDADMVLVSEKYPSGEDLLVVGGARMREAGSEL